MAKLTPNSTYTINGVLIKEKIIPDGTRWQNAEKAVKAGFSANSLYKKQRKLTNNTGKATSVTIHNTDDLDRVEDDGEQYVRATYNENMNSVRVHFYVDDICAWQEMKAGTGMCAHDPIGSAEVSWHSGDGSIADGGNMTSISMEIIMNDNAEHDKKAYDNGARIAAWLLWRHGLDISALVTHTYWVNKLAGMKFNDIDVQSTSRISGQKWCPVYIFKSYSETVARENWIVFKKIVGDYLDKLNGGAGKTEPKKETDSTESKTANSIPKVGDIVMFKGNTHYRSANASTGYAVKASRAKVMRIYQLGKSKHPYSLRAVNEAGEFVGGVYGWVDESSIEMIPATEKAEIKVGSHVKVKSGAKVYGRTYTLAYWVYKDVWIVKSISGKRVVIDKNVSGTNSICSPVSIDDLTLE